MIRRKNGEGSWGKRKINGIEYDYFRKKYNGKEKVFYGKTVKEIKQKIQEFEDKNIANMNPNIAILTIQEYMFNWIHSVRKLEVEGRTLLTNIATYSAYIKNSPLGQQQIVNITTKTVQEEINRLTPLYSRSVIKKVYYLYNLCYKYAIQVKDLQFNPCVNVIIPKESAVGSKKKNIPFLEISDIDKLYNEASRINSENCCTGMKGTRVYGANAYAIPIILYTGLRSAELCALQWGQVDLVKKQIRVVQALSKGIDKETGKEITIIKAPKTQSSIRTIPLPDRAVNCFTQIKQMRGEVKSEDFVITTRVRNLSRVLDTMLQRSGCKVTKCGLHALRHSYGSMLLSQGVDIKVISMLMGHSDITTTANIYVNVSNNLAFDSVSLLNKINNSREE